MMHDQTHPGIHRTLSLVKDYFFWPSMKNDLKILNRSCDHCQKGKIHRHNYSAFKPFPKPHARFENLNVDIIGPMTSSGGFKYILSIIDRFTRFYQAIPLPNMQTNTVIAAFISGWVSLFGCPKYVQTDRGTQFTSKQWNSCMEYLGIDHRTTHAYSPFQNGMVERACNEFITSSNLVN